jgi:hypothetical protein
MTDPKPARTNLGRTLTDFSVPSEPGNERLAMETLADVWHNAGLRSVIHHGRPGPQSERADPSPKLGLELEHERVPYIRCRRRRLGP